MPTAEHHRLLPLARLLIAGVLLLIAIPCRRVPRLSFRHIDDNLFAGLVSLALLNVLRSTNVPHVGVSFVALSTAFPPLVTYLLFFMLRRVAGPVYLSQVGSVAGICGAVIAIVFFDETPAASLAVAAIFIVVGIFLDN